MRGGFWEPYLDGFSPDFPIQSGATTQRVLKLWFIGSYFYIDFFFFAHSHPEIERILFRLYALNSQNLKHILVMLGCPN